MGVSRCLRADQPQALAHLQHARRVHDVLGGGAPVDEAPGLAALAHELVHQRQDRIANHVGLLAQQLDIERRGVAALRDLLGCVGGNDAAARLRLGPRRSA
jgi:hypothetical protein